MARHNKRIKTRLGKRAVIPAINPGSLDSNSKADQQIPGQGTPFAKRIFHKLLSMTDAIRDAPMPPFVLDTRRMDRWLDAVTADERTSFLSAFIDQASMIQSNRRFVLVGPQATVNSTLHMLHMSEGGEGFRRLMKLTALNYYSSNFGGAIYLHRNQPVTAAYRQDIDAWDWSTPPVVELYATDPTEFAPTGDYIYPYDYYGEPWTRFDFIRTVSMPSTRLATWGVGRCPVFRCIQIAQMTSAVYQYIFDSVSPDTAKGIVVVKGMSYDEFVQALMGSEATNEQDAVFKRGSLMTDGAGDIVVLADDEKEIGVKFVQLGRLPDGFFIDQWVRWTLTAFSVNLGFPLEEFIGMPANTLLGQSGAQVTAGVQRGSTKGGSEFINQLQEAMQQYVIPSTVHFEFSDRDAAAEADDIALKKERAAIITSLFGATQLGIIDRNVPEQDTQLEARAKGLHIINDQEARRLLVEWEVLPDWITSVENTVISDEYADVSLQTIKSKREQVRDSPAIQRLAANPMGQPVIEYTNFPDPVTGFVRESTTVLWDDDNEIGARATWAGVGPGQWQFLQRASANEWLQRTRKVALDHALSSDHTTSIARILRRSLTSTSSATIQVSAEDKEELIARVYALAQLGRDNVAARSTLRETTLAQIGGSLYEFARNRVDYMLSSMPPPTDPDQEPESEKPLAIMPASPNTHRPWARQMHDELQLQQLMQRAVTDDTLRPMMRSFADDEAAKAFAAGQFVTADVLGKKNKAWTGQCNGHAMDGEAVGLYQTFSDGAFWAGQTNGCTCSVKVS